MRIIEQQMLNAITKQKKFKQGNTEVAIELTNITIRLYNRDIATIDLITKELKLYDGSFKSATTKSRLNAILSQIHCRILQKQFKWIVTCKDNAEDDKNFYNGFTLDWG